MCRPFALVLLATLVALPAAHAGERIHYLYVVNRAHDAIVSVSSTPVGGDASRELLAGERLAGGGDGTTLQVEGRACVHDLRMTFADGRRVVYPAFDLCRQRGMRVMPLPARSGEARLAVARAAAAD